MATWQFDLHLMSQGSPKPTASDDGLDFPGIPAKSALQIQETVGDSLGNPWLMMDDWLTFGTEIGTRVDFLFDDTDFVEVLVRLDANLNNDTLLDAICAQALELDCRYFDAQGGQFIEPQRELILHAMASSRAAKFVKNPHNFIDNIPPSA